MSVFETYMTIVIGDTEREFLVEVTGNYCKGYRGSFYEPPEPAHFEINDIKIKALDRQGNPTGDYLKAPDWLLTADVEDDLAQLALEDYQEDSREAAD